jgi:hypothetical protein
LSGNSTGPEASAAIEIIYSDAETARFILEAISPDNLQAPQGIMIEARVEGSILKVIVSCVRGVGSLTSTVDDLLSCVQAAEKAISGVAS